MAPPLPRAPPEVIDLTIEDDNDAVRQSQPRPPGPPQALANGATNQVANRFVDTVPGGSPFPGSAHAHPYAAPRPAQEHTVSRPHAHGAPSYTPLWPAKRQKLSEPERVITNSASSSASRHLSPYARDAVEALKNKDIDEDKLKAEVSQPPQHYGTVLSQ